MVLPGNLRSLGQLRSRYRRTRRGAQAGRVALAFQGGGNRSAPQVGMVVDGGVPADVPVSQAGAPGAG